MVCRCAEPPPNGSRLSCADLPNTRQHNASFKKSAGSFKRRLGGPIRTSGYSRQPRLHQLLNLTSSFWLNMPQRTKYGCLALEALKRVRSGRPGTSCRLGLSP